MTEALPGDPPSPFVIAWASRLAPDLPRRRRVLDVAMGRGRHALALAALGLDVYGIDWQRDLVRQAVRTAEASGVRLRGWCADLRRPAFPAGGFDLVVVTRYLQRDLFDALGGALAPGGVLLYETFTTQQRLTGRGPTSPAHLLEPGELKAAFATFDLLAYEETTTPDAVARLAARKP